MQVDINGDVVDAMMSMPSTGSWATYSEVKVPARLKGGSNRITLTAIGYSGPDVDYLAIQRIGSSSVGEMSTVGEAGTVVTIDANTTPSMQAGGGDPEEQWQVVQLGGSYTDPVVIIGVPSEIGSEEAVARVRNLRYGPADENDECDGHCFDLRMQEPSCRDDEHLSETIPVRERPSKSEFG